MKKFDKLKNFFDNANLRYLVVVLLLGLLIYVFINRLSPTHEIIIIFFLILSLGFGWGKKFIKDWYFILIFFYVYEWIRGHARYVHEYFNIQIDQVSLLDAERFLFGENIPTLVFQKFTGVNVTFIDYASVLIYVSFFFSFMIAGYLIWRKNLLLFVYYKWSFVFMNILAVITFLLYPASPPWHASEVGLLPELTRNSWEKLGIGQFTTKVFDSVGYNRYAPFPSLHMGWTCLVGIFLQKLFVKDIGKFSHLFYVYPFLMLLTIIYTGDHYVVDAIGGLGYCLAGIGISKMIIKKFGKKSLCNKNYS